MKVKINFNDLLSYFKVKKNIENLIYIFLNIVFWIFVFMILLMNAYSAGSIFLYHDNHDHHLAFLSYLGGMAANGILPGIDFYSPHSIFIPLVVGIFFKILGVNQVNIGIADGVVIFLTMVFVYKTARFFLPNIFAKLAVLTLLLSHTGRDNPWFNDFIMLFVAMGVYIFASYIKERKNYKLIILGIVIASLPYMRQQGLVIGFTFLALPIILFYAGAIIKEQYQHIFKTLIKTFIISNLIFWLFVLLRNGFEGLEILFSSLTSLVDMAQPAIGYENTIPTIANYLFNYTTDGMDWHGYFMRYLSYWFIVILPALYFVYRPFSLNASKIAILNEDSIRFIVALITLSTMIFNYPINEDARLRVQFGIGIALFIDVLYLCFWNKNIKILSIIALSIVFLFINHTKVKQFVETSINNFNNIKTTKSNYYKMGYDTPYAGMKFKADYASHLQTLLSSIESYHQSHPDKEIIFDGELVDINNYLFLLFSSPKIALQHKFPYYYGTFSRESFFPDIQNKFDEFVATNKPIIIGCEDTSNRAIEQGYKVLNKINEACNILVPIENEKIEN
ncbi:hypothetical protein CCY99_00795 [Helicobacter sp. 16-1353]|uniref:glycosyltransferase family 39 protein n=1 Tax=Helicobacter sp. 16-1353 TaxID=2004996 RepID=UPI000DCB71DF|nr:glycosyltransferase family 39 protein [Helicobacter sp. 16-1353]RAX55270.1 hypothetical protein CCY99_00795 [Helicobacter sp. 16-1353]